MDKRSKLIVWEDLQIYEVVNIFLLSFNLRFTTVTI